MANMTHGRWNKGDMPEDIKVDSLTSDQTTELDRLKDWLYRRRTEARQERERTERRERKEADVARREAEQPALSQFQHAPMSMSEGLEDIVLQPLFLCLVTQCSRL